MASKGNPTYSAYIVNGDTTYDITPVLISIDSTDQEDQMAQKYTLTINNVLVNGVWSTNLIEAGQRVFIYADDGETKKEVMRGFIWTKNYTSSNSKREFKLTCYDNLIYMQESEVYYYYPSGKSTEDILKNICNQWGVNLSYNYESITHEQLVLKGTLSNIIMKNLLNPVRDRTGKKYVLRMREDTLYVDPVGENTTIYQFNSGQNVIQTKTEQTMDGMITRVVIFGKQGEGSRAPVEATVEEHVEEYGTLQKVYGRAESASLEDAKKEADKIVCMNKWPFWEYEVQAPDIPWIRKGDVVYINAGDIYQKYLVCKSVQRSISNKSGAVINLVLDDGKVTEYEAQSLSTSIQNEVKDINVDGGTVNVNVGVPSDGSVNASQQAVINAAYNTISAGWSYCAKWVSWVFAKVGIGIGGNGCDMVRAYCHYSTDQLKPGMIIGAVSCATGSAGLTWGHIAIYVGNNTILSSECGTVARYTLQRFNSVYGTVTGLRCGWAGNIPLA